MTNEEAKMFLDNLKVCIDEHPIVADWLVEIADRKTEPRGEWIDGKYDLMCSNCENTQEYEKFPYCPYCGAKMTDHKTEPLDKDINVRSKDEPQDECAKEYEELGLRKLKELRKDEPQTERSE